MSDLLEKLKKYEAYDEQEEADKQSFLQFLEAFNDNVYTRDNLVGHICASCWIVNKERTKVLMAYHNIYKNWAWLGGHADGEKNLLAVAVKEAKEEANIANVRVIQKEPIDINITLVNPHIKKNKQIGSHLHYNPTYLLEVDENDEITNKPDENSGVKWIKFEDIVAECKELAVIPYYLRIVKKIKERNL